MAEVGVELLRYSVCWCVVEPPRTLTATERTLYDREINPCNEIH